MEAAREINEQTELLEVRLTHFVKKHITAANFHFRPESTRYQICLAIRKENSSYTWVWSTGWWWLPSEQEEALIDIAGKTERARLYLRDDES